MDGFKSYQLTGNALDLLKAYAKEIELNYQEINQIQKEAQEKAQALTDKRRARMRELWVQMAASVGIDPHSTWESQSWSADCRFLEHDFGAITYYPPQPNPLSALLGQPEDDVEESPETVPEGTAIN